MKNAAAQLYKQAAQLPAAVKHGKPGAPCPMHGDGHYGASVRSQSTVSTDLFGAILHGPIASSTITGFEDTNSLAGDPANVGSRPRM